MVSVAIVAFVMGKNTGNDDRKTAQKVSLPQITAPEKVVQSDNVPEKTPDTNKRTLSKAGAATAFDFDESSRDLPTVTTQSIYLADLPEKVTEDGPYPLADRNTFLTNKGEIDRAKIGDSCGVFFDGLQQLVREGDFCEIQKHGDAKGILVIFVPREDKEFGYIEYNFYKDDYLTSIKGSFSRRIPGSGNYNTDTFLDMKKVIDAYTSGVALKIKTRLYLGSADDEKEVIKSVDFNEFFSRFRTAIDSVRYIK